MRSEKGYYPNILFVRSPTFLLHPSSQVGRDGGGAGDDANVVRLDGGRLEQRR